MSVVTGDIDYRLSGGAANSDPNASIGGAKSSTEVVDATINNLFDDVSGDEHTAGYVDYRCIYIHNSNATDTLLGAKVWIASDTSGADSDISIALGTSAIGGQEQGPLTDEETEPSGVSWSDAAVSRATGLAIGDLDAAEHKAIWIRRTISAGATPQDNDTCSIQAGGDTV